MSVTVQITSLVPTGYGSLASLTTVPTPQLSPPLGVPRLTLVALQEPGSALTVTAAGQLMLGAWSSTTITVWVQLLELPLTSVTVQTTALVPTGYGSLASLTTVPTPQLSLVLAGGPSATPLALHRPTSALTATSAGQLIDGRSVSLTVTVKLQPLVLPAASVAPHVTAVTPTRKVEPLGGLHTTVTLVQLSLALTAYVTLLALHCPASVAVTRSAGQLMAGASLSTTTTCCVQVFWLP